jgi:PDZ domain-containing protein
MSADSTDPQYTEPDPELDEDELRRRRTRNRLIVAMAAFGVVVVGLVLFGSLYHVPYYLLSPGGTYRTQSVITVKGAPTYDDPGSVEFVTVSVTTNEMTAIEWVWAHLHPDDTIAPASEIVPKNQSPSQNQAASLQEMADAKTEATVVALEHLGYKVTPSGTGAVILDVVKHSAADGVLHVDDTVVRFDGRAIHTQEDLSAAIHDKKPGDRVELSIEPPSSTPDDVKPETRSVTLGHSPTDSSLAFLGVESTTRNLSFPDLPVHVSVSTPDVGGPSAGLAITLGILDVMTKGSITGGHKVATTGTIDLNGCVGPIGGMHQKVVSVKESGAVEFIVPRSEYAEAKKYAGNLKVVPVDDTDEALQALTSLGGGYHVVQPTANDGEAAACKPAHP